MLLLILATLQVVIAQEDFVDTTIQQPSDEVDIIAMGEESHVRFSTQGTTSFGDFAGASVFTQRTTATMLDSMDILVRVPVTASFMSVNIEKRDDVLCEAYGGGIVCQDTRVSGGELFCWGNNRVQECPRELTQLQGHGGGSGKVSVEDVVVHASNDNKSTEHHEEIEVLSWSWGSPTIGASNSGGFDDDDGGQITLDYVWFVDASQMRSGGDDRPSESLSLAFGKIEITYQENGKSVELNVSDVELHGNLVFGTVTFGSQAISENEITCRTGHLLRGGDCDDTDPVVHPDAVARMLESCTDDVCVVGVAARCGDDSCVSLAAEHCRDESCVAEVASYCSEGSCFAAVAEHCRDENCVVRVATHCRGESCNEIEFSVYGLTPEHIEAATEAESPLYEGQAKGGDGVSTVQERTRGPIHRDLATRNARTWDSEDRRNVREYLRNQTNLTGADFGLAVALIASENERVRTIHYSEERNLVEIEHKEEMRIFGLFTVRANSKTTVHEDGTEETRRPWWSFVATKDENPKFKEAGIDLLLSEYVENTVGPHTTGGGSGKVNVDDIHINNDPTHPDGFCDWCTWCC